jgi:predicted pyridoxine 5'-phosphate oxidase superfamily flavin-nucleotide-binding protein
VSGYPGQTLEREHRCRASNLGHDRRRARRPDDHPSLSELGLWRRSSWTARQATRATSRSRRASRRCRPAKVPAAPTSGWRNGAPGKTGITPDLARFIEAQTSIFLGTANKDGQPYIQHRGGPPGFLQVLDDKTIGFADFAGNRQYITQGNLADNPKAYLFLIDYARRQRIKLWGEARVIEGDAELTARLMPEGYKARAEQVILFTVAAWDANCPQHIPQRFEAADIAAALAERDKRIAMLEGEIERLRGTETGKPG